MRTLRPWSHTIDYTVTTLSGDTLKVCGNWPGAGERPGEFAAGPDTKRVLTEFKREKP
jgi:hypothetical protein